MGRKEEEAAWARVGKKPPMPSRHAKPKRPKPLTPSQQRAKEAAERRGGLGESIPGAGGRQGMIDILSSRKPQKKK